MRHAILFAIVLGGVLADCQRFFALDPSLNVSQYAHTAWTAQSGYALGNIYAIAQTPDGYLWLGGEFGLFRFDGVSSTPWHPSAEQHPRDAPNSLLVTRDSTIWIGTFTGLVSVKDGKLTRYPELDGLRVTSLLEDREGTVWASALGNSHGAQTGRLCSIRKGSTQCYGEDGVFGFFAWALYEDSSGALWAGAESGLWRWKPGPPTRYAMPGMQIRDLSKTDDGRVLISMHRAGLKQVVGDKIETYPIRDPLHPDRLLGDRDVNANKLLRDRDGGLWIGTRDHGLIHVHQGRTDVFKKSDGLSGDGIMSLFEDREGNVWVSTDGGLDRFRDLPVTTILLNQRLFSSDTNSVIAATDGSMWVATWDGLARWKDGQFTFFLKSNGLPDNTAWSLYQDDRGRIWVFTKHGLAYFKDGRFVAVNGGPNGEVYSITGDKTDNLWLSGNRGLTHLVDGHLVEHFPWSALGRREPAMVVLSQKGGVWISSVHGEGVAYFKDRQVRASYTAANGLGKGNVPDLRTDRDGALWVSTEEGGLSRIKDGRIATLTTKNGLPCDAIHFTMEDNDHSLWLYAACGLVRIARPELDAWIADPRHRVETAVWDAADGVRLRPFSPDDYSPPAAKSPDGKLWFLTGADVQVVDPRHLVVNTLTPPVHIEKVLADHKAYFQNLGAAATSRLRLPPRLRDLQIDFNALSLVAPEKVHFKYMLEGQDREWREVVNVRQVQYSNLPPGAYRFRVVACNNSGVWNEQGDVLDFSIAPAYYQTNWFRVLCGASFLTLLALGYWWRIRAIENRAHELELQVGERTAELQVAKEKAEEANHAKSAFLASVSHDLRTPLNGILGYAQILKKTGGLTEKQESGLEVIQQSGDHLLTLINDILELSRIEAGKLELNPAEVHVPSFLSGIADIVRIKAEQKGVLFVLATAHDLPEGVCADERRLRQVLLNLLDNAVKFTDHGRVVLQVDLVGGNNSEARLRFEVADTGVGMSPEQLGRIFQPFVQVGDIHHRAAGMGLGLAICRRLVKLMGGEIQVQSEPGQGTTFWFEVTVPLTQAVAKLPEVQLAAGYRGPRKRVLVVDDVPANRAILAEFLSTLGFEIAEAENGEEGLKRACEFHPDLILMDGVMPIMDGLEATQRLRQMPGFEGLPIIGISASASGRDAAAFLAAGASAFLTKPVAFPRLLAKMGTLSKIDWVYESRAAEPAKPGVYEQLVLPPHEELVILHKLAVFGDMSQIEARADYLAGLDERYRPLAAKLHQFALGYQTKAILAFVEECMAREHIDEPAANS